MMILLVSFSNYVEFAQGLLIDPFVTHNQLNKTINAESSFSFLFDEIEPNRRLGFQIQSHSKDVLKIQIIDENNNPVNATVIYNFDAGVTYINSEFEPQGSTQYSVIITNLDKTPTHITGMYGIMLSVDEINEIFRKYGNYNIVSPYDPTPSLLIIGFVGVCVGIVIGYFLLRNKIKKIEKKSPI